MPNSSPKSFLPGTTMSTTTIPTTSLSFGPHPPPQDDFVQRQDANDKMCSLPFSSSSAAIDSPDEAGRGSGGDRQWVASQDISPGTLLLTSFPYVVAPFAGCVPSALSAAAHAVREDNGKGNGRGGDKGGGGKKKQDGRGGRNHHGHQEEDYAAGASTTETWDWNEMLESKNNRTTTSDNSPHHHSSSEVYRLRYGGWCASCFRCIPAGSVLCNREALRETGVEISVEQRLLQREWRRVQNMRHEPPPPPQEQEEEDDLDDLDKTAKIKNGEKENVWRQGEEDEEDHDAHNSSNYHSKKDKTNKKKNLPGSGEIPFSIKVKQKKMSTLKRKAEALKEKVAAAAALELEEFLNAYWKCKVEKNKKDYNHDHPHRVVGEDENTISVSQEASNHLFPEETSRDDSSQGNERCLKKGGRDRRKKKGSCSSFPFCFPEGRGGAFWDVPVASIPCWDHLCQHDEIREDAGRKRQEVEVKGASDGVEGQSYHPHDHTAPTSNNNNASRDALVTNDNPKPNPNHTDDWTHHHEGTKVPVKERGECVVESIKNKVEASGSSSSSTTTTTLTPAPTSRCSRSTRSPCCSCAGCEHCGVLLYCSPSCWQAHRHQHARSGECHILRRFFFPLMQRYFSHSRKSSSSSSCLDSSSGTGSGGYLSSHPPGSEPFHWSKRCGLDAELEMHMLLFSVLVAGAIAAEGKASRLRENHSSSCGGGGNEEEEDASSSASTRTNSKSRKNGGNSRAATTGGDTSSSGACLSPPSVEVVGAGGGDAPGASSAATISYSAFPSRFDIEVLDKVEATRVEEEEEKEEGLSSPSLPPCPCLSSASASDTILHSEVQVKGTRGVPPPPLPPPHSPHKSRVGGGGVGVVTWDRQEDEVTETDLQYLSSSSSLSASSSFSSFRFLPPPPASFSSCCPPSAPYGQQVRLPTYSGARGLASLITNYSNLSRDQIRLYRSWWQRYKKEILPLLQLPWKWTTAEEEEEEDEENSPRNEEDASSSTNHTNHPHHHTNNNSVEMSESFFYRLAAALQCNSFGIFSPQDECLASGLYPEASLFNHSCAPNVCRVMRTGRTACFYSLRKIAKGEPLTISYITVSIQSTAERRQLLWSNYRFFCGCPRCRVNGIMPTPSLLRRPPSRFRASDSCLPEENHRQNPNKHHSNQSLVYTSRDATEEAIDDPDAAGGVPSLPLSPPSTRTSNNNTNNTVACASSFVIECTKCNAKGYLRPLRLPPSLPPSSSLEGGPCRGREKIHEGRTMVAVEGEGEGRERGGPLAGERKREEGGDAHQRQEGKPEVQEQQQQQLLACSVCRQRVWWIPHP